MKKINIIAGHAGVGKTYLASKYKEVLDFDHLLFKYMYPEDVLKKFTFEQLKGREENRKINPSWPQNYIKKLDEYRKEYNIICVPAALEILDYLEKANLDYILCYPKSEDKEIYMKRYRERGTNEVWIQNMDEDFENTMKNFNARKCNKMILKENETLEDKLKEMKFI